MSIKEKIFRDPVHGYISVPVRICEDFIDTEIFQRLRYIEQTGIRVLYPAASHDRFSHSLGVYHLGRIAHEKIKLNCNKEMGHLTSMRGLEMTFQLACLLHDCAHAPFSHTLEGYYFRVNGLPDRGPDLVKKLTTLMGRKDVEFEEDFRNCPPPSEHEILSAIVLLEEFKDMLDKHSASPELAVRMIVGCPYRNKDYNSEKQIQNIFIRLLNGPAFDVDKLDYIMRDTFVGGINSVTIDVHRLLASLRIVDVKKKESITSKDVAFDKSAISVIRSVIEGKTFLSAWVHNHHIVKYNEHLLKKSVENAIELEKLSKMFSLETFTNPSHEGYLVIDGDIIRLLKKAKQGLEREVCTEAREYLSREYDYVPLWKTYAEFSSLFCDYIELYIQAHEQKHPEKVIDKTAIEEGLKEGHFCNNIRGICGDCENKCWKHNFDKTALIKAIEQIGKMQEPEKSVIKKLLEAEGEKVIVLPTNIKQSSEWENKIYLLINKEPKLYSEIHGVTPDPFVNFPYVYVRVDGKGYEKRAAVKERALKILEGKLNKWPWDTMEMPSDKKAVEEKQSCKLKSKINSVLQRKK